MGWLDAWKAGFARNAKKAIPDGVWVKCEGKGADAQLGCGKTLYRRDLEENLWVCPSCGFHMRIGAHAYLDLLLDEGTAEPLFETVMSADPLQFKAEKRYGDQIMEDFRKTGRGSAFMAASGAIYGRPFAVGAMDFSFRGGSLGSAEGEKINRLIGFAQDRRVPLVIVSQSGGARMQEAALSLMQMAKTSARLAEFAESSLPFISVLTSPTTGGVTASFAMLGDVILAEPGALIGFAGARVRETIKEDLPPGFQRAEFLLEHGFVDRVVDRRSLKEEVARLTKVLAPV
ncbi:MAG TPA: acetyl-CoA carboxylase, carboxyltransferase subunit beta [Candidatus Latescibacteria bacterium]|nr:acetyl-CoA carboxylase, carboxyltransferase subunit beta [Candidatus Latescibacterota bacterium]